MVHNGCELTITNYKSDICFYLIFVDSGQPIANTECEEMECSDVQAVIARVDTGYADYADVTGSTRASQG